MHEYNLSVLPVKKIEGGMLNRVKGCKSRRGQVTHTHASKSGWVFAGTFLKTYPRPRSQRQSTSSPGCRTSQPLHTSLQTFGTHVRLRTYFTSHLDAFSIQVYCRFKIVTILLFHTSFRTLNTFPWWFVSFQQTDAVELKKKKDDGCLDNVPSPGAM